MFERTSSFCKQFVFCIFRPAFVKLMRKINKSLRRKKKKEICIQVKLTIQKETVNKVEEWSKEWPKLLSLAAAVFGNHYFPWPSVPLPPALSSPVLFLSHNQKYHDQDLEPTQYLAREISGEMNNCLTSCSGLSRSASIFLHMMICSKSKVTPL